MEFDVVEGKDYCDGHSDDADNGDERAWALKVRLPNREHLRRAVSASWCMQRSSCRC